MMRKEPEQLDAVRQNLERPLLIEAAAGTGKTYAITTLTARLLLEKNIPVTQLVILSFTRKAAAELEVRIRKLLTEIGLCCEDENAAGACPQAGTLVRAWRESGLTGEEVLKRLAEVRRDLDSAQITTINGFCQKILQEFAFEVKLPFNARLNNDYDEFLLTQTEYFRKQIFFNYPEAEFLFAEFADDTEKMNKLLKVLAETRTVDLGPKVLPTVEETIEKFRAACANFGALVERSRELFTRLRDLLNKQPAAVISRILSFSGEVTPELLQAAGMISADYLRDSLNGHKKRQLLAEAGELIREKAADLAGFADFRPRPEVYRDQCIRTSLAKYRELKRQHNFITYYDQCLLLAQTLQDNEPLKARLRAKFTCGLIDEFQDTDPRQLDIFRALFLGGSQLLILVGDPRQAIYGFRGGDLPTYLCAREEIAAAGGEVLALNTNYRSSPGMVDAVNTIFHGHDNPFSEQEITYPEIRAGLTDSALLVQGTPELCPLQIFRLDVNKGDAVRFCCDRAAAMLNSPDIVISSGGKTRRLRPGDIAVLCYRNEDLESVCGELAARGIAATFDKRTELRDLPLTKEFGVLLTALLRPEEPAMVRTALAGPFLGLDAGHLLLDEYCRPRLQTLPELAALWAERGMAALWRELDRRFRVRERLIAGPDGEQALVDLLHLEEVSETLAAAAGENPERTLRAFLDFLNSGDEGEPGRISSAEDVVRLATFHGSKGLEYPVVFIPLAASFTSGNDADFYHEGNTLYWDCAGRHRQQAVYEDLCEKLRLFYVSVTRAKYYCEVVEHRNNKFTALDWLLDRREMPENAVNYDLLTEGIVQEDGTVVRPAAGVQFPGGPGLSIQYGKVNREAEPVRYLRPPAPESELQEPPETTVAPVRQIISFTGLEHGGLSDAGIRAGDQTGDDREKEDEEPEQIIRAQEVPAAFQLPGGTVFGTGFHRILEEADFGGPAADRRQLCRQLAEELAGRGTPRAEEYTAALAEMVEQVLHTPLTAHGGRPFTLAELPAADCRRELEFYLPLQNFSVTKLREAVGNYLRGEPALPGAEWPAGGAGERVDGLFHGYADLWCRVDGKYYLMDWKTNFLERNPDNFYADGLRREMISHLYFLQYLFYTVSLVKQLQRCGVIREAADYDRVFGGIYYIFVRGVNSNYPGRGIFYARPPLAAVEEVSRVLYSQEAEEK